MAFPIDPSRRLPVGRNRRVMVVMVVVSSARTEIRDERYRKYRPVGGKLWPWP